MYWSDYTGSLNFSCLDLSSLWISFYNFFSVLSFAVQLCMFSSSLSLQLSSTTRRVLKSYFIWPECYYCSYFPNQTVVTYRSFKMYHTATAATGSQSFKWRDYIFNSFKRANPKSVILPVLLVNTLQSVNIPAIFHYLKFQEFYLCCKLPPGLVRNQAKISVKTFSGSCLVRKGLDVGAACCGGWRLCSLIVFMSSVCIS